MTSLETNSRIMVNELVFKENKVRHFNFENKNWFILKDIANVLGLKNIRQNMVKISEVASVKPDLLYISPNVDSIYIGKIEEAGKGGRPMTVITEVGMYQLLLNCKNEKAKEFKEFVSKFLLPSVSNFSANRKIPKTFSEALRLAADLEDERIATLERAKQAEEKILLDQPKVEFAEACEGAKNSVYIGNFAKFLNQSGYKIGQNNFFKQLCADGLLMQRSDSNYEPTQKAVDLKIFTLTKKFVEKANIVRTTVKITQKGQQYLFKKYVGKEIENYLLPEEENLNGEKN